ncbi:MAG: MATE family efflux transporter [Anaerotignum faecicola]
MRKFSAEKEMLLQATIVAIPSILQQCFVSVGNLFVQSAVNSYGSAVVAGFSACQKLNTFAVTCMTTLSNGVSSFTAQNLGAAKKERVSEGFRAGGAPRYSGLRTVFPVLFLLRPHRHGAVSG